MRIYAFLLLVLGFSGCVNPCQELAELRCDRVGSHSESCAQIKVEAESASVDEMSQCANALKMGDTLSKNR